MVLVILSMVAVTANQGTNKILSTTWFALNVTVTTSTTSQLQLVTSVLVSTIKILLLAMTVSSELVLVLVTKDFGIPHLVIKHAPVILMELVD